MSRSSSRRWNTGELTLKKKKKKKNSRDYFKCMTHRRIYPPGALHYLVPRGLGFLNVLYY
jgi:hypothetical protein